MLIVQVYHPQKEGIGEYVYRVRQPAEAMGGVDDVQVIIINVNSPWLQDFCLQADVVIWHLVTDQDALWLMEERKRRNLVNIYEISDNIAAFQPHDPMREYFNDPVNLSTVFLYANMADAVQVTSEELIKRFGFLNQRMVAFKNQIKFVPDFQQRGDQNVRIGWGGSVSHSEDLKWISPVIVDLCRKHDHVSFSFMGTERGIDFFKGIPEDRISHVPPGSLQEYYDFLDTIDVGLAPLCDTEYNRCRSDIKFVEYASRGVVPVLSALAPYEKDVVQGETAFLFRAPGELWEILEKIVISPAVRLRVAQNAQEYVKNARMERDNISDRIDFYRKVRKNSPKKRWSMEQLSVLECGSDAYAVKKSNAEKLLYHGMNAQKIGDPVAEKEFYREAMETDPFYYIPHFWLGDGLFREGRLHDAASYLQRATELNPQCLQPRLLLGLSIVRKDRQNARRSFAKALRVSSRYAPAWHAMGMMLENGGDWEKATLFFQGALEGNSFFSPGFLGLARCQLAEGKRSEAQDSINIATDILPNHEASWQELERLSRL